MSQPPRRPGEFPADQFCHDVTRLRADQVSGGWRGREDQLVLRCVLPALEKQTSTIKYAIDIALMLYRSSAENEIVRAMVPDLTLKGIGAFEHGGVIDTYGEVGKAGKAVAESVAGFGGVIDLVGSVANRVRGISDSHGKRLRLESSSGLLGTVSTKTKLLTSDKILRQAGLFDPEKYDAGFVQSVYTKFNAEFTPEQVKGILSQANNVPLKYGGKPRLIARFDYPERLIDSIGNRPAAAFAIGVESAGGEIEHYYQPVEMNPVTYTWE